MAAGLGTRRPHRPRVLVTGFGPFPGAPVNPTEWLVKGLVAEAPALAPGAELRTEVLPVEYAAVPTRLAALGVGFAPDIAVHFGLKAGAEGFTLERLARNEVRGERPDNAGQLRAGGPIVDKGEDVPSSLPLKAIHDRLTAAGLPVSWSDDAGGYLCNYLFYLSCAGGAAGFAPRMAGFIHVPPLVGRGEEGATMRSTAMLEGARLIVATCLAGWHEGQGR